MSLPSAGELAALFNGPAGRQRMAGIAAVLAAVRVLLTWFSRSLVPNAYFALLCSGSLMGTKSGNGWDPPPSLPIALERCCDLAQSD